MYVIIKTKICIKIPFYKRKKLNLWWENKWELELSENNIEIASVKYIGP